MDEIDAEDKIKIQVVILNHILSSIKKNEYYIIEHNGNDVCLIYEFIYKDVKKIDDSTVYSCVHFKDIGGKNFDVDILVGVGSGGMFVEDSCIFKIDGNEFFFNRWYDRSHS